MPNGQEIVSSIYGAWRILRFDPGALTHFNQTVEGFWRSFFAALLVAPAYLVSSLVRFFSLPAEDTAEVDPLAFLTLRLLGFALAWIAFPVAMIWLTRLLQFGQRYVVYIIVWNWSSVVAMAIMLPLVILLSLGVFPEGIAGGIMIFAFGCVLFYAYLVARVGLECGTGTAIAIVVFEVVLDHLVDLGVSRLFQSPLL
ncbi:MAG: hypothetical protein QF893_09720 [Alphaproteobacteria bacterium]|jgi:hypothetical protein|nr:hypothetical protein [Alphaproteobacteria bacterium]